MIQSTPMETSLQKQPMDNKEYSQNGETERRGRSPPNHAGEGETHILADRYKTKLCKNYLTTGLCAYKTRCMFAHGDHELRTSAANIRDGLVTEEAIKAFQQRQAPARRVAGGGSHGKAPRRPPHPTSIGGMSVSYHPPKYLPPSFEEATRQVAAQWIPPYEGREEEGEISPMVIWEETPAGRRCYRHNPYLPALLHAEDCLWSAPLPMEEEGGMIYPELDQQIPYEEGMAYEAPSGSNGYFPAEIYGDAEPFGEVNRPPTMHSTASEIVERCSNWKLSTSLPMKQGCSSVNMYEEDELRSNTGMILEP